MSCPIHQVVIVELAIYVIVVILVLVGIENIHYLIAGITIATFVIVKYPLVTFNANPNF